MLSNFSFFSWLTDFNMQAEAAIPEDIFDQQHIQDVDDIDANSMQFIGEGHIDDAAEPEADIVSRVRLNSHKNICIYINVQCTRKCC